MTHFLFAHLGITKKRARSKAWHLVHDQYLADRAQEGAGTASASAAASGRASTPANQDVLTRKDGTRPLTPALEQPWHMRCWP